MERAENRKIVALILPIFLLAATFAGGQENRQKSLALLAGIGISNAYGEYPEEMDSTVRFSFKPGLRLGLPDLPVSGTDLIFDLAYWEAGFFGTNPGTYTYTFRTYSYLTLNAMARMHAHRAYYGGGIYLGSGLDAYEYREYEDRWVYFDPHADFGLVGEAGPALIPSVTAGVQARLGIKNVNLGLLLTVTWAFYHF